MSPQLAEALPYVLIGLVVLVVVIWLVMRLNRKTNVIGESKGDVLDEGAVRARRNQSLIDTPGAAPQDTGQALTDAGAQAVKAGSAPAPASPHSGNADDLRRIKGVGPKLVAVLAEQGVTRFDQIAAWSDADIDRIDATLGRFAGRITRDRWVEQAKLLAAGDDTGFAEKFGQT